MIIRQRGRRRISINWSPEKTPSSATTASAILRTPTKPTSTMTLRSSPRKRLHLDGSSPISSQSPTRRPIRTSSLAIAQNYSPLSKRLRLTESPIAQQNLKTPLIKMLKGLSNAQLINIIQEIVNNEPNIESKVRSNLPMPDIKPYEEQLITLKKNIFKSLPSSRLVKNTDAVAYSRAATHLATFKKTVVDQVRQLNDSENWDAVIDYCLMAWQVVRATPIWDNKTHNTIRRGCFKILSYHCLCALKAGDMALGEQRLTNFLNSIESMQTDCDDITSCVAYLENTLDKIANVNADI